MNRNKKSIFKLSVDKPNVTLHIEGNLDDLSHAIGEGMKNTPEVESLIIHAVKIFLDLENKVHEHEEEEEIPTEKEKIIN
jgi:hypothetical protein